MQTTVPLHLDDALLAQAEESARAEGCELSQFIEELLRQKLAMPSSIAFAPFDRLTTFGGQGLRNGINLDSSAGLLAAIEEDR